MSSKDDRATAGSAVIETLVAFPLVYLVFTIIIQLCYLEVASLVTGHASVVAARAAIVVAADDPRFYGSAAGTMEGKRRDEVEEAVRQALRTSALDPKFKVSFGSFEEGKVVKAKVELDYPCTIPFGGPFVCGLDGMRHISREATLPYQGASYEYP